MRTEWMTELIMWVLEDTRPLSGAIQEHAGAEPRTPGSFHPPPRRWGHTHLDSTTCPSCASFIPCDCSSLVIVFYCHKVSVGTVIK